MTFSLPRLGRCLFGLIPFVALGLVSLRAAADVPAKGTYRDPALPTEQRVQDLLQRMSVDEKVGQLNQRLLGWHGYRRDGERIELTPALETEMKYWGIGAQYGLLRADPWSGVTWETGIVPEKRMQTLNRIQKAVVESNRWGIPALFSTEAPHGHMALGGVILPTALGLGATWNPALYQEAARSVSAEVRLSGEHLTLIAALDIAVDPRWGRTEECFGEDPVLVAAMARAATLGTQGEKPEDLRQPDRSVVILKHLAGQGAAAGGRNAAASNMGPREFREIHLPPARAGIQAGALGFMAAYNEIDGIPCCTNPDLLRTLLRDSWGFHGLIMADGFALDNLTAQTGTTSGAGMLALRAGVDLSLWDNAFRTLADSVRAGWLDEKEVDRAVASVLHVKFALGLFDRPYVDENPAALQAAQTKTRELNRQLARESIVLLRNEGGMLPFRKGLRRVAVIGPNADHVYAQLGDYTPPQREGETTTVLAGLKRLLGKDTEVVYAQGVSHRGTDRSGIARAVELAKSADVAVVVVGGSSNRYQGTKYAATGAAIVDDNAKEMDTGEGVDLASLELGGAQLDLVKALQQSGVPLAVVLIQGRPYSIPWIAENCPAVLSAWYPGQEGGNAVAEVLFGDVNPSGRLPISIPRSSGQLPVAYNFKIKGDRPYFDLKGTALYSFGYGLSYTTFALSNLKVSNDLASLAELNGPGVIEVSVDVANTGSVAGAETVQVYLHGLESAITRRVRELKQFEKVTLAPGEKRKLSFKLGRDDLAIWGPDMTFAVGAGLNEIIVQGGDQKPLTARVRIE